MKLEKFMYIYPPRPVTSVKYNSPTFNTFRTQKGWTAQLKWNGQRNCIYFYPDGKTVELWNRHQDHHKLFKLSPELAAELRAVIRVQPDRWSMIDGELMYRGVTDLKSNFYVWDPIVLNGEYQLGTTYGVRYQQLLEITGANEGNLQYQAYQVSEHIWVARNLPPELWDEYWKIVDPDKTHVEGFVLKNLNGRLTVGYKEENNTDWVCRCRAETGRHRF